MSMLNSSHSGVFIKTEVMWYDQALTRSGQDN